MSTSYHHGDLKAQLLVYAREQMERANLDGLSMREMAKAIGVSHTAAYRHFSDKGSLLDAVAVQGFEELAAASDAAVAAAKADPRSRLKASGLAYVGFGLASPHLLAHMFSSVSQPRASATVLSASARLFEKLHTLVAEGQSKAVFRAGDVGQLSHSCWAMVHGLAALLAVGPLHRPGVTREALMVRAEQALEVLLDGVERQAAASSP